MEQARRRAARLTLIGMALAFSAQLARLKAGHSAAVEMAKADADNDNKDALS